MTSAPQPRRILVVDDRLEMAETLAEGLRERGYLAVALASGPAAAERLGSEPFDLIVTDLRMPDLDGLELLKRARRLDPDRPVIVMTAFGAIDSAVESIRSGAYHYLTKPFKIEELAIFAERAIEAMVVRQEAAALRKTLAERFIGEGPRGLSATMRRVWETVERVAATDVPVLVTGETGTGKGLIARAIHAKSNRLPHRFVAVNCAALPEQLLEAELFGHVKGAFTGASADRPGLFVEAAEGTLFLDEIGELPGQLQAKLLHVLEGHGVRPLGSTREREVRARIVAATHRSLADQVRAGGFREDLLYRLNLIEIVLPPLRERREDLPDLIEHFFRIARLKHRNSPVEHLSASLIRWLLSHSWPGNVRELAHLLERLVLLGQNAELSEGDLPETTSEANGPATLDFGNHVIPVREVQRQYAIWALKQLGGQRMKTAERLGVDSKTLSKWLLDTEQSD